MTCDTCVYGFKRITYSPVSGLPKEARWDCLHDSVAANRLREKWMNWYMRSPGKDWFIIQGLVAFDSLEVTGYDL